MSEPIGRMSRRQLLKSAGAVAAFTIVPRQVLGQGQTPPSERISVVSIGAGGRAADDINEIAKGAKIIALCDVDQRVQRRRSPIFSKYADAKVFQDYREMLDKMDKQIDGVIVGTPDHTHAVAAMAA